MNATTIIEAAGWTLAHFLWQGVIAALVVALLMRITRSATTRYLVATASMVALSGAAVATFLISLPEVEQPASSAIASPLTENLAPAAIAGNTNPAGTGAETDINGVSGTLNPNTRNAASAIQEPGRNRGPALLWQLWVVGIWLGGVGLFAVRFLFDWRATVRLRRSSGSLPPGSPWSVRFETLVNRMGITRPVRLLTSATLQVPVMIGVLRPAVVSPVAMLSNLPPSQVDAILLHELAHIRRNDFLVNLLQILFEMLFFFHPVTWWISRKIRQERENCCDDQAASQCDDLETYASALFTLEESRHHLQSESAHALAADGRSMSGLLQRVRRLADVEEEGARRGTNWPIFVLSIMVVSAVLASFSMMNKAMASDDVEKDARSGEKKEETRIRGVQPADYPSTNNATEISDIFEPIPDKPGRFRQKDNVFFMSLGRVGPWLYQAAGSDHYYLQVRPDPEIVADITYGPIPGDPVKDLDLAGWLKESPSHPDPGYARRVARDMIACGDSRLAGLALDWLGEFPAPSPPDEHDWLIRAIQQHLKKAPQSKVAEKASATLKKMQAQAEQARNHWKGLRPVLPEEDYQPGEKLGPEHAGIHWSKASPNGLRLGIKGIRPDSEWQFGEEKNLEIFVYNEGNDPIKFAWTPRTDEGLRALIVGEDGSEWQASISRFSGLIFHMKCRLDPGHVLRVKPSASFSMIDTGSKDPPGGHLNFFEAEGHGSYQLRFKVHLGTPDWTDTDGTPHPRPAGEWSGTVESDPISINVTKTPVALPPATPAAEASDEKPRKEGGLFDSDEWSDEKHAHLPFGKASENGLRVARFFDPMQDVYEMGSQVKGRIIFYNSGTEVIEFSTHNFHQGDTWNCHDGKGNSIEPFASTRMGMIIEIPFRLEPGHVIEVSAQGTAIGAVPYDHEPGRIFWTSKIPAHPGDEITCSWDVTYTPKETGERSTLPSGEFTFRVKDRPADFPVDLGIARTLGKFDLAEGIKLQRSRGRVSTATIEWKDGHHHQLLLTQHDTHTDPHETIVWKRGDSALWILGEDLLRKVDFSDPREVKETTWPWPEAPASFGNAPALVRKEIEDFKTSRDSR